jgi:TonB-linked SusC/RagA family outer membrane protein
MRSTLSLYLAACALAGLPALAQGQQSTIVTGRVTADAGTPVQGVSVGIPSASVGGLTNAQGEYSFTVPVATGTARLVARRIGYQPYEATVALTGGTVRHDLVLERSVVELEQVVTTALGIEREKRSLGVAQQQVAGDELAESRETNLVNSLVGKVSGVAITNAGPQGGSSRIVIRGANSISGNNQPLFIVDGVPVDNSAPTNNGFGGGNGSGIDYGNTIQDINPNDIESVSILKGPNAAALYGSRAANGAIIITTKSGKSAGGFDVTVNQSLSFETPLRLPDYQNQYGQGSGAEPSRLFIDPTGGLGGCDPNAPDYAECGFDFDAGVGAFVDESWGPALDGTIRSQFFGEGPWVPAPDNVESFFETGRTSTTNLALSGSTDRTNIRLSGTYMNVQGLAPGNVLERSSAQINGGARINDRLSADASLQYVKNEGQNRPGTGYDARNFMQQFIWFGRQVDMSRLRDYKNEDGEMFNWNYNYHDNPYWLALENDNWDSRDRIVASGSMGYQFTDWIRGQVRLGTDWYRDFRKRTYAVGTKQSFPDGGFEEQNLYRQESNAEFLLTAQRPLTTSLTTTINFGGNARFNDYKRSDLGATKLIVPGIYNMSNALNEATPFDEVEERRVNSLYGSAQFGWNDYLFLDVTGRNDWSSTLPEKNNSYFYPSVSTSFIFTDAVPALRMGEALGYGKLRASWTRVGNDAAPYQTLAIFPGETVWNSPEGAIARYRVSNQIANADLKPEETTAWEVGTELRFLDSRVVVDATYYDKATENQILAVPISATSGFTSQVLNAGRITNKGVELLLDVMPVRLANGFRWNSTVNFAQNDSKVAELYGSTETVVLQDYWSLTVEARKGEKYGALYGNPFLRDEDGNLIVRNGRPVRDPQKRVLGHYTPDWTAGWNNQFSFRGVDFNFLFDWKVGGELYSTTMQWGRYAGVLAETAIGRDTGIVVQGIDEATGLPNTRRIPAETYWHSTWTIHESNIFDASYVKLREVKLGYSVPADFAARVGASSMYLSLFGRNLWLSTDVPHIDPETAFAAGNVQGLEFAQFPSLRSFGFNVSVTP